MTRSIATVSCLVWIALGSPATATETQPALAPPGRCAEPRVSADAKASAYPVVGPVSALFDPLDVAAGPPDGAAPRPEPPSARGLVRPGSCDQPGSGCGIRSGNSSVVEPPPILPGVRPPRASN